VPGEGWGARALPDCKRNARVRSRRRLRVDGFGDHSPGKYSLTAALIVEIVMTFMFLMVIHGTTHRRAPIGFAGMAIGLCLTLIHLISIPVTNTLVNPARSTGPALFVGGWAVQQLWPSGSHRSRARCSPAWSSARSSSPTCRSRL
jgi:glycerol uptake facilitator-like aquaporin